MRLGRFDLEVVSDGEFRLDGGAMFGVVPKALWNRVKWCDEQNRIRMATNCLLIRDGREVVLVDTGIGDKLPEKARAQFGLQEDARRLPAALAAVGCAPEDVTHVLLTHLHFDHCGWNTRREPDGRLVPTFPNARYWLCRGEVEHARQPNERDRVSYLPENWEPLFAAGVVELFDETCDVVPGVHAVKAPGHNADMCIVLVDGGPGEGERAAFLADLVPHAVHAPIPWVMGYDLFPVTTLEQKRLWLPRLAAEARLCVFEHDADTPLGRIVEEAPGRYRAEVVAGG
jgi:glyoxylase-like metal-dependent hydrolase (beta-lactamase superfamily II)